MSEEETLLNPGETPETTNEKEEIPAVTRDEFDKFQKQVTDALALVATNLADLSKVQYLKPKTPEPVEEEDAGPDQDTPVPPAWKKAVVEILGPDFECELKQPDRGGTLFTVVVPKGKSNASQLHWQQFKADRRTKELGNTGIEGVKGWCIKIRANLTRTGAKLVVYP